MLFSPQTALAAQPQPMAPPAPAQPKQSLLPKILPTAVLSSLFLKGTGGLAGLSGKLSEGSIKGAAGGVAAGLLQNQAKNTINGSLAQNLSKLGFNDFDNVPRAAEVAIPAINKNMEAALQNSGHVVDVNGLAQRASDLLDKEINVSEPKRQKVLNILNSLNATPAAVKGFAGQPNAVDALKELRVLDSIKSKSYSAWQASVRSGKPDEEQHSIYSILRDVTKGKDSFDANGQPVNEFDGLERRIFSNDNTPIPLDEMTKSQMIQQLDPLKEALPDVYNNMAAQIRGSKNLLEARHLMADLTQGTIAHDKMSNGGGVGIGGGVKDLAHGPLGIPMAVLAGTGSPMDALSAALMQSHGANVGLTSIARNIAK